MKISPGYFNTLSLMFFLEMCLTSYSYMGRVILKARRLYPSFVWYETNLLEFGFLLTSFIILCLKVGVIAKEGWSWSWRIYEPFRVTWLTWLWITSISFSVFLFNKDCSFAFIVYYMKFLGALFSEMTQRSRK